MFLQTSFACRLLDYVELQNSITCWPAGLMDRAMPIMRFLILPAVSLNMFLLRVCSMYAASCCISIAVSMACLMCFYVADAVFAAVCSLFVLLS